MPSALRHLPLILLVLAAAWLRCRDLAVRPMHTDEANQAVKAGQLLESGHYAFDPKDHHGPVLYYAALPLAWIRGQHTLAQLDETTVRLLPALAGTLSVLLLAWLAAPIGFWPALAAAAFLALSPPSVYYSRYFVQETLMVTFTLAAFAGVRRWWLTGRTRWALVAGACYGLMQATKETAPLFALAGAIAAVAARPAREPGVELHCGRDGALALAAAVAVAVVFFSSFGTHFSGVRDALDAYGALAARLGTGATGHEKPWWYFLQLFTWQRNGGLVFEQTAFAGLAVAGFALAVTTRDALLRWTGVYTGIVLLVLSATAYKTPWHAINLVPGLAILAGGALAWISRRQFGPVVAAALAALVLATGALGTFRTSFRYAADARNPYAYVHSSPDVLKFRALVQAAALRHPNAPIRIISEEYWPLPWYLRGLDNIGYWDAPPADCDGALVIVSAGLAQAVRVRLHEEYRQTYLGLRPGFVCLVLTPEP